MTPVHQRSKAPEWELHPEKFTYYLIGNPDSRFAITHARGIRHWRFPWQRPRGGWWVGPIIVWWSM